tara:strand:+ start:510 stop:1154 length:645 start_codon:yes stop_codon:yes gene_type:complete
MNRDIRVLHNNKANNTKIVSQKPSNSEGFDGDIAVGNTANGSSLFAKIKNVWYEFSSNESFGENAHQIIEGSVAYTHGAYTTSATVTYVPFLGLAGTSGGGALASLEEGVNVMILPYDCRVKNIMIRSDIALGDTSAHVLSAVDGEYFSESLGDWTIDVSDTMNASAANTAYTLQFNKNVTIPRKSNIAVGISRSVQSAHTLHFVLTLDYDIPG